MIRPTRLLPAMLIAALAGSAFADTINGNFTGSVIGFGVNTTAGNYNVGALRHNWSGGTGAAAAYVGSGIYTFCMDLSGAASGSFSLIGVTAAPNAATGNWGNSGAHYTVEQEKRVNAIAIAARDLGYLNGLGQFTSASNDAGVAIQLLVWESLWESTAGASWDVTSATGGSFRSFDVLNVSVTAIINSLTAAATSLYANASTQILVRSFSSTSSQDQMVLVPLPPAALAGLGTLAGVIGIGYIRRRRLASL